MMSKPVKPSVGNWKRMQFKNHKVWIATDEKNHPVVKNHKVLIKYQLDQDYEYWVHEKGVTPIDSHQSAIKQNIGGKRQKNETPSNNRLQSEAIPKNAICVYTDGASSGNPGPAGIGIHLKHGPHEKGISRYIGIATNNVAELEAIKAGLLAIKNIKLPVRVFTDSRYALGVLSLGWKVKSNRKLIQAIKSIMKQFDDFELIKVKGHSGDKGNEKADYLAILSVKKKG